MSNSEPERIQPASSLFITRPAPDGFVTDRASRGSSARRPAEKKNRRRTPVTIQNWIGRIGAPLYFAALMVVAFAPGSVGTLTMPEFSVHALQSLDGVVPWITFAAGTIALGVGRFAPLGFLAAFALPRRRRWARRVFLVAVPSAVIASVLAAIVLYGTGRTRIDAAEMVFAAAFCGLGAWLGMTWLRGWRARFLLLARCAGALLVVLLAIGANLYASLQAEPFESGSPKITSDTTRRIYRMFRGKNPKSLEPGETATLQLSGRDLNEVLAWSTATMIGGSGRVKVELAEDTPHVLVSVISPVARGGAKYLNAIVGGGVRFADGRLVLDIRRLRLGSIEVPQFVLAAVSPELTAMVNRSQQLRPFLDPVHSLKVTDHGVVATYGHADLPSGAVAALFEGEGIEEIRSAVTAHAAHLIESEAKRSAADRRFGASLEAAFRFARERSKNGDPRLENQAAILALGMLMGHSRVEQLVGPVIDVAQRRAAKSFEGTTLRQREDWTHHFFVSASISVLSTRGIGDGVGLFKEELDSDGGSGFSFGDLLADRAGVTFALAATRDEASARALQDRLARGYRVDDFMPAGEDLPENMQQAEFKSRFGGVDGAEYRRVAGEIERRIAGCAAYKNGPAVRGQSS